MSIDKRGGSRIPDHFNAQAAIGTKVDPGPYIGIVKNVYDPTRSGRLQVWISEFGGDQTLPQNWTTVSYASPFMGVTRSYGEKTPTGNKPGKNTTDDAFEIAEQSYGMWMVPPDIDNQVLVTFAAGNPDRGFWFACILDNLQHHMPPGMPGSGTSDTILPPAGNALINAPLRSLGSAANLPLSELNNNKAENFNPNVLADPATKRPLHEIQAAIYIEQGLDRDPIRGPGSGSSQRETPSSVFGISTPGRPISDYADGNVDVTQPILGRKGGHIFVMDDGDGGGRGKQMRFRTSGGHQILLDDTNGVISVHNANGTCWFEMAQSGQVHLFSAAGINIRSKGDVNLHSDSNLNMYAKKEIRMKADSSMRLEGEQFDVSSLQMKLSGTQKMSIMSLQGSVEIEGKQDIGINTGSDLKVKHGGNALFNYGSQPKPLKAPKGLTTYTHPDVLFDRGAAIWRAQDNQIKNTPISILPSHEPWDRKSGIREEAGANNDPLENPVDVNEAAPPRPEIAALNDPQNAQGGYRAGTSTAEGTNTGGKLPGLDQALAAVGQQGTIISDKTYEFAKTINIPDNLVPPGMNKDVMQVVLATLASAEGGFNYQVDPNATQNVNHIGLWQFSQGTLETLGFLPSGFSAANGGLDGSAFRPINIGKGIDNGTGTVWTGPASQALGISSSEEFLNSPAAQQYAAALLVYKSVTQLQRSGAIDYGTASWDALDAATQQGILAGATSMSWFGIGSTINYLKSGSSQPTTTVGSTTVTGLKYFDRGWQAVQNITAKYSTAAPNSLGYR